MERKRNRMEIISDMLRIVSKKEGKVKPTHLMYKANLSHIQMKKYLKELSESELIIEKIDKDKKVIGISKKGRDFLNSYAQMKELFITI